MIEGYRIESVTLFLLCTVDGDIRCLGASRGCVVVDWIRLSQVGSNFSLQFLVGWALFDRVRSEGWWVGLDWVTETSFTFLSNADHPRMYPFDLDLHSITLIGELDLNIFKVYLHTIMKFLGQDFQTLEHERDKQTCRRDRTHYQRKTRKVAIIAMYCHLRPLDAIAFRPSNLSCGRNQCRFI